jgi:hypothetical protein
MSGNNVLMPDYFPVKWLENAGAVWGEKTQLCHSLGKFCLRDEQHCGQQKIKSFCFGKTFCHPMSLNSQ